MSDAFSTHGAFSWNELITSDPAAAKTFYTQLFGWTTEDMPMGPMTYTVIKNGDQSIGGIMDKPPQAPPGMPSMWGGYVTVDNVDAMAKKVVELGGKILATHDIPEVGRFIVIQDPQGAMVSAITYAKKE